mgnify:CR=1 FL=1
MAKETSLTSKLDDVARVGWMYYIAGNTQDEIAQKLGVSRQSVQRMVSLAFKSKLIKVKLDHPIAKCMELGEALKDKFGLIDCQVVPSDPSNPYLLSGVADAASAIMENYLKATTPTIIALGTGRTLLMSINELSQMDCSLHKMISLVGNITDDGSASFYEVITRMADKVKIPHYPLPLPVLASNKEEKALLHNQKPVQNILTLAKQIDVAFVGIGHIGKKSPLYKDGFISEDELMLLKKEKAVGEIIGWIFDKNGDLLPNPINDRIASVPLYKNSMKPIYAIGVGKQKAMPILAALRGRLVNCLITDEMTASLVLAGEGVV